MTELFYLQFDGKVFLIQKSLWTFPDSRDQIPFPFEIKKSFQLGDTTIHYGEPHLDTFPEEWMWREDAIISDAVAPIARHAMLFVSPYIVGKAVIIDATNNIVVVKGSRGGNKGKYTVPGGIGIYGEDSRQTTIREAKEECGLDIEIIKTIAIVEGFDQTGRQRTTFVYLCRPTGGELKPNMDDVSEAFWVPLDRALKKYHYYVFTTLKDYLDKGGTVTDQ